jgi:pilus assembly protein CpaF
VLINPFAVRRAEGGVKKKDISEVIENVVSALSSEKAEVIAGVESGDVSLGVLEAEIVKIIDESREAGAYPREIVISLAFDSIFGYGPLEPYLKDPDVSDIFVNGPETVFIKKLGKKFRVPVSFGDEKRLLNYCRRVAAICGGRINENESETVVTDRKRNLRIVISTYPVNVSSPSLAFRKPTVSFSLPELLERGMMNREILEHLRRSVRNRETIIIAGKGGSGKTSLLGALINEVPQEERGLLIQETNEISVFHPDIVSQLVRLSDLPGTKSYTLFELTRFGLLLGLDRMFIGELKDKEAMDFFNAVFTGHRGSMATVHANSAEEVIDRLVLLMKRADTDLSGEYLKELLAGSLDQVVFMSDYKICEISRVAGYDAKSGKVLYERLFSGEKREEEKNAC